MWGRQGQIGWPCFGRYDAVYFVCAADSGSIQNRLTGSYSLPAAPAIYPALYLDQPGWRGRRSSCLVAVLACRARELCRASSFVVSFADRSADVIPPAIPPVINGATFISTAARRIISRFAIGTAACAQVRQPAIHSLDFDPSQHVTGPFRSFVIADCRQTPHNFRSGPESGDALLGRSRHNRTPSPPAMAMNSPDSSRGRPPQAALTGRASASPLLARRGRSGGRPAAVASRL